jgi:hypothetical protein
MVMAVVVAGSGENPLLRIEKGGEWRRLGEEEKQLGFGSVSWCIKEGRGAGGLHPGVENDHVVIDMFVQGGRRIAVFQTLKLGSRCFSPGQVRGVWANG